MLLTKTVKIKWNTSNKKWYEEKGYTWTKRGEEFEVSVDDLTNNSMVEVQIYCDYCLKKGINKIITKPYRRYIKENTNSIIKFDCCSECVLEKREDIKNKKQELGILTPSDDGYWSFHNNRLKELDKYIKENRNLNLIFKNGYNSILQSIYTYNENILDMVLELNYNLLDVCDDFGSYVSFLRIEHILLIFKDFIKINDRFPTNNEIYNDLKLTTYCVGRFGGLSNIKRILNINDDLCGKISISNENRIDLYKYSGKSGIYKITNILENKVYIGQATNLWERIRGGYINSLPFNKNHNKYLQRAWNKYGEENFTIEIMEECKVEDLDCREQYWMDYYKSYDNKNGYNICKEAGSCRGIKNNEKEIDRKRKWALESNPMKGKHHTDEVKKVLSEKHSVPIMRFNIDGYFLDEWNSALEASKSLNIKSSNITMNTNGKSLYTHNFIFCKKEDDLFNNNIIKEIVELIKSKKSKKHHLSKPIIQYDLSGNLIKEWEGASEASRQLGINKNSITHTLLGFQKTGGGFKWEYKK